MNKIIKLSKSNKTMNDEDSYYDIMDINKPMRQESSSTVNFKIHFKLFFWTKRQDQKTR